MKKRFSQLNYYEMLDLKPDAVLSEIRHAYNDALQMYQPGALASYSFFSEEERHEVLALLDRAYATLVNEKTRKEYDDELISRGDLPARDDSKPVEKKPVSIFDIGHTHAARTTLTGSEDLKTRVRQSESIGEILNKKDDLCGADFKKIRTELGVSLEQIVQETKVRMDHLRSIEEDNVSRLPAPVFLKGFVKAYLKCLCLEPVEELSARYIEHVSRRSRR